MSPDFWHATPYSHATNAEAATVERGIRLYCQQHNVTWLLQTWGPLKRVDGTEGRPIVAHAVLDRDALVALRDAINVELGETPKRKRK